MKIKVYAPETGIIIKRFNAYSYKELMRNNYKDADSEDYLTLIKDEGLNAHFKNVWDSLKKYEVYDDRGNVTDFIFINCS